MDEYKDQLDQTEAEKIKSQMSSLRELISKAQGGDSGIKADEVRNKTSELQKASLKLFEIAYKKRAEDKNAAAGSSSEATNSNENTADAEYRDVNDEKKINEVP